MRDKGKEKLFRKQIKDYVKWLESQQISSEEEKKEDSKIVKKSKIPDKYRFLKLPRENMTPAQRRWKWVSYDRLPSDMKPFLKREEF